MTARRRLAGDEGVDGQIKHKEDFSQRIEIPFGHTFLSVKQTSLIKQTDIKFKNRPGILMHPIIN